MNTEDYITQSERDDVRAAMARMQELAIREGLCVRDEYTGDLVWTVDAVEAADAACAHELVWHLAEERDTGIRAGTYCMECGDALEMDATDGLFYAPGDN